MSSEENAGVADQDLAGQAAVEMTITESEGAEPPRPETDEAQPSQAVESPEMTDPTGLGEATVHESDASGADPTSEEDRDATREGSATEDTEEPKEEKESQDASSMEVDQEVQGEAEEFHIEEKASEESPSAEAALTIDVEPADQQTEDASERGVAPESPEAEIKDGNALATAPQEEDNGDDEPEDGMQADELEVGDVGVSRVKEGEAEKGASGKPEAQSADSGTTREQAAEAQKKYVKSLKNVIRTQSLELKRLVYVYRWVTGIEPMTGRLIDIEKLREMAEEDEEDMNFPGSLMNLRIKHMQMKKLEYLFRANPKREERELQGLAVKLRLPTRHVLDFFAISNRRAKARQEAQAKREAVQMDPVSSATPVALSFKPTGTLHIALPLASSCHIALCAAAIQN